MDKGHLNGWKEIGSYLGRAGRTAQRWEIELGMPVHRPARRKRAVVVGFPSELDAWLMSTRPHFESEFEAERPYDPVDIAALGEKLTRLQTEATQLALKLERARAEVAHFPQASSTELTAFPDGSD